MLLCVGKSLDKVWLLSGIFSTEDKLLIGPKLASGCVVPGSWSLCLAVEKANFEGGC